MITRLVLLLAVVTGCGGGDLVTGDGPEGSYETRVSGLVPARTLLISPEGDVGNRNPTYVWNDEANSDQWQLWVNDGLAAPRINQIFDRTDAQMDCTTHPGECSITPPTLLAAGPGRWWIRGINIEDGPGPWSSGMSFTIAADVAVVTVGPSGSITTNTPMYRWIGNVLADSYRLYVLDVGTRLVVLDQVFTPADAQCVDGTNCHVIPALTLAFGPHTFWIQTNSGPWSVGRDFTVTPSGGITAPIPLAPMGSTTDMTPDFSWNAVSFADSYDLWVNDAFTSPRVNTRVTSAAAGCSLGVCTFNPGVFLGPGPARWWVRARAGSMIGPWSAGTNFDVTQ